MIDTVMLTAQMNAVIALLHAIDEELEAVQHDVVLYKQPQVDAARSIVQRAETALTVVNETLAFAIERAERHPE